VLSIGETSDSNGAQVDTPWIAVLWCLLGTTRLACLTRRLYDQYVQIGRWRGLPPPLC
jgi:hypothetical protein